MTKQPLTSPYDGAARLGSATTLRSVRRAAQLLLAVAEHGGLSAREAAERFDLSLPTAYHLLNSLASEGLMTKARDGRYHLGPLAPVIADAVHTAPPATPHHLAALDHVVTTTGETAYISAWNGPDLQILALREGTHPVRACGLAVDYAANLHARTSARLLLAFATPDFRTSQLRRLRLRRLTPTTITTPQALHRDLRHIRATGLALGRDEYVQGLTCASVPITESGTVTAALTAAAPTERFVANEPRLVRALREAAALAGEGAA